MSASNIFSCTRWPCRESIHPKEVAGMKIEQSRHDVLKQLVFFSAVCLCWLCESAIHKVGSWDVSWDKGEADLHRSPPQDLGLCPVRKAEDSVSVQVASPTQMRERKCLGLDWVWDGGLNRQTLYEFQMLWWRSFYSASVLSFLHDAPYASRTPHGPGNKLVFSRQEEAAEWWCGKPFSTELQKNGISFWRFFFSGLQNCLMSRDWHLLRPDPSPLSLCHLSPAISFQLYPSFTYYQQIFPMWFAH